MRWRRLIGLVALLGVLLHAAAIVRHHEVMVGAALQYQALLSDLAVLCHGDGEARASAADDLPRVPIPTEGQSNCPICAGHVAAFVLPSPEPSAVPALRVVEVRQRPRTVQTTRPARLAHPPARGPPTPA